jgi:Zn-dependent protease/CBS domain-containing protein
MFGTRLRLFRVRGIWISLDVSWLIIVALLTWAFTDRFKEIMPGLASINYWGMGLITALAFFVCVVLHELGHALVAQSLGIPMRGITLFLLGGVAELEGEPTSAGNEFLMAIAGPLVSAVLVGIFWVLASVGAAVGWNREVVLVLEFLGWINLSVLVFNMVPAFPLDGGRVLRSILWGASGDVSRATYWASLLGRGFAWVLIILGILQLFTINFVGGLLMIFVGLFLNSSAQMGYQQVLTRQLLHGEPVRRFMTKDPIVVPPSLSLRQWVEDYVYQHHHKTYPVGLDGQLKGIISTADLARFPRAEWDQHTVGEAMREDLEPLTISPDADALHALEQMQHTGASRLLVIERGQLVGLVSLKDLLRFLQLKLELETNHKGQQRTPIVRQGVGRRETPATL